MKESYFMSKKFLGIGSPIVDLLAKVEDDFIDSIPGEKGGMELVSAAQMISIIDMLDDDPVKACGGSAANTTFAAARLGIDASFLGQLGKDADGEFYTKSFVAHGGDDSRFKYISSVHTARCLSLVTPDSERTMRTDLGAAALLDPESITLEDFAGIDFVHVEGYLLFNPALALKVLQTAKEAGCEVSLDLGAFEVVRSGRDRLDDLLRNYVDYVFANEDESKAFTDSDDPLVGLEPLGELCKVAVVKLGAAGVWAVEKGLEPIFVPAYKADKVVDTTGTGDYWAAGFIWGVLEGKSLADAVRAGALLGCEAVQQLGADLEDAAWERIYKALDL